MSKITRGGLKGLLVCWGEGGLTGACSMMGRGVFACFESWLTHAGANGGLQGLTL